jgi:hypothetical protein
LTACSDSSIIDATDKATGQVENKKYETTNVECGWKSDIVIDTFYNDIKFKIQTRCQENINFIDTINESDNLCTVRHWHDMEFIITSTLYKKSLVIEKSTFKDSLASDLTFNGFLTPPTDIFFNQNDSSITLKTFIGHADSDVGDIYVLQIDKSGISTIKAVEELKMGETD